MVKVIFVVMVAVLVLIPMFGGCTPSTQAPPPITVDNKGTQVPIIDTRISSLESELANCQSINVNLQKQIDQSASASNAPTLKEPVSGESVSYTMQGQGGPQNAGKYVTWNVSDLQSSYSNFPTSATTCASSMSATVTNNHPNLAMTNVTVNGLTAGPVLSDVTINPGQTLTFKKSVPIPGIVDFQIQLAWVWK